LLDLDHVARLEDFEAVSPLDQEDHITRFQDAAIQVFAFRVVEIHPEAAISYDQDFLGAHDFPRDFSMDMGFDPMSRRVRQVPKLLAEFVGCEEVRAGVAKIAADYQCIQHAIEKYFFDHAENLKIPDEADSKNPTVKLLQFRRECHV
jgi:hypothetical protein